MLLWLLVAWRRNARGSQRSDGDKILDANVWNLDPYSSTEHFPKHLHLHRGHNRLLHNQWWQITSIKIDQERILLRILRSPRANMATKTRIAPRKTQQDGLYSRHPVARTYRQIPQTSFMDVDHNIVFQCLLRNWYSSSILRSYLRVHLETRRTFNFHDKATSLLHWRCSFLRLLFLVLLSPDIYKEGAVCWRSLYHGTAVLFLMLLYPT